MAGRFFAQVRQQWMGGLALLLVLTGGTAYAADTVFSSDIVDGEVKTPDLASNAVGTGKIGSNQVFSADVRDDTFPDGGLTAVDLAANSVGASEVEEASLGTVPDASTLDGLDSPRYRNTANVGSGQCTNLGGTASSPNTCASTTLLGLTAGDDVYVIGSWAWHGTAAGRDDGSCTLDRGTAGLASGRFGQNGNEHNLNDFSLHPTLIGLDTNAPAGTVSYSLRCAEGHGEVNMTAARVIAIRLSG